MEPILIIAPHMKIYEVAAQTIEKNDSIKLVFGLLEDAIPIARDAEAKGAQVIVSRGGTTNLLEKSGLNIPVVDIAVSPYNVINTIHTAKNYSKTVTVLGSIRIIRGVEKLGGILDVDLEIHELENKLDAEEYVRVRMMSERPIKVLLGGAMAESLAKEYGIPTLFLETGRDDIEKAIEEASKLLEVRRREARKTEQFRAILDNINHGVIAVDQKEVITTFNKAAGKITGVSPLIAQGKKLSEVLPQNSIQKVINTGRPQFGRLLEIGRTMTLSNMAPVKVGPEIAGAVQTLEDVTKIREYENIIRLKMTEKGHVAHFTFDDVLGGSPIIKKTTALAAKYATVDSTVLIEGESGSGKEVFAQAIHNAGIRRSGPFIALNCGALHEDLLESELMGYREGAFTGARQGGKDGLFTLAHTGTIFLDEISETSLNFQTTLLRVIQEMEVRPIGSDKVIPIDIRIIVATNKTLKEQVELGVFRSDLYYRLNILRLLIPPLKSRKEDIAPLSRHFLSFHAAKLSKNISITKGAMNALKDYHWPGNIRELQNIVERICVTCNRVIEEKMVAEILYEIDLNERQYSEKLECQKTSHILNVLEQCGNNKTLAAQKLGISRTTLWRELNRPR